MISGEGGDAAAAPDAAIAIPNLLARYADLFDAGDFAGAAALFDGGCVIVGGREITGRDAIAAMWREWVILYDCGTPRTRHLVTNPHIQISADGRSAECGSQWMVLQQIGAEPLRVVGSGRYADSFRLEAREWRFARREYGQVDFWGETGGHLKRRES